MAKRMNMVILLAAFAMALRGAEAALYVVGDALGWQNPPNSSFYSSWASSHNFAVGDTLLFNFTTGVHAVATVSQDAYNNCNTGNTLSVANTGPANITLNASGMHYYFCTFPGHCSIGQKLAVNVGLSPSFTPSPPGTTASPPPPPPPPRSSSASSNIVSNVALMWMSIVMGFMYI
ncbi:umecyanin [Hevea brasiliensis]|uniref:umecyanin n=1 Tax=Hevea brasiliensis TaxID=3981 RepID=UPI0025EB276C|nr:umecyanin [Hevea brasiliensis]